jgi:hypothetical protein
VTQLLTVPVGAAPATMNTPVQPRAIVEVRWGPSGGRKWIIEPGERLRIGRTHRADLVLSHDTKLSSVHCELFWNLGHLHVRDLKSKDGTLLGGEPVEAATVPHGAWIRVGATDLSVYFEGYTRLRAPRGQRRVDDDPVVASCRPQALATLRAEALRPGKDRTRLYAVLDTARSDRILQLLRESVEEYRSLYQGMQAETLAGVAPYLVELSADSRLLEALVNEGWGHRWGIYLSSTRPAKPVRRHLRRFLMVEDDETHDKLLFRFYDPNVLADFLPVSTVRQRSQLMTDVTAFIAEEKRTGRALRFDSSQAAPC